MLKKRGELYAISAKVHPREIKHKTMQKIAQQLEVHDETNKYK